MALVKGNTRRDQGLVALTPVVVCCRVPAMDCPPPELLETIFGLLDVGTLCTARLVCAHFRGAASRFLHSIRLSIETLRSRPETTLNSFPNLSRVSVFSMKEDDLLMLAESPVAAAVTQVRAVQYLRPIPRRARNAAGSLLPPLPNLTSLTVSYTFTRAFSFPQTLRELDLEAPVTFQTANSVAGLSNLTRLRIDVGQMVPHYLPQKLFEAVTALTALQSLEIRSNVSLIPFTAELPLLTHLQFHNLPGSRCNLALLASLSRLHRLAHLGLHYINVSMERQVLASIASLTGLRSLDLHLGARQPEGSAFETACMAPFSELTALKLCHHGFVGSDLERFNLERLRDLSFSTGMQLGRDGVAALRRATGLTHLSLWKAGLCVGLLELGKALQRMSGLRALSLGHPGAAHVTFTLKAIARLTELTRLELTGDGIATNAAVDVCLGLKKLRDLRLTDPVVLDLSPPTSVPSDRVIREMFFAIARLPELRKFVVMGGDFQLGEDIRARLNAERQAKGWPPLELGA